jgi:hypothetical protein
MSIHLSEIHHIGTTQWKVSKQMTMVESNPADVFEKDMSYLQSELIRR